MDRLIPTTGFLLLSATVIALLGFTIYEAQGLPEMVISGTQVPSSVIGSVVVVALLAGACVEMVFESRRLSRLDPAEVLCREHALNALSVAGGAVVTFVLSIDIGLGGVTASALVALIAAYVIPDYAVPVYCGSFVGMASTQLLYGHGELALAGAVAAVIYVLTACTFPGIGGKLGTIAFAGSVITALGLGRPFLVTAMPDTTTALLIIIYSVVATVLTFWLNVTLGHGAVIASAIVGITGGLVLPVIHPMSGGLLAVVVFCASFAGMASGERFPKASMMVLVGLVAGLIFVFSMPVGGGAGGKLGTIAFASCLAVRGFGDLVKGHWMRQ
jgi:hypothetical protein